MTICRTILMGAASVFALSTSAFAQDQSDNAPSGRTTASERSRSDIQDEIIIVEARRRDEVLQDVPFTINAVTSDTIAKLNIRTFQEVTSVVPGLSLTPNANGIGSSSSMRGVNQDVNVSGENGTIQFYFNDAPVGSNFVLQAMYDIGQVEVLRGPQGTLRGRSTPSGSITVAPRRPDLTQAGGTIMGTVASDDALNVQFGINVPIIADKLAVRIAGLGDQNRGSRIRSINSNIEPRSRTESIRASVRFEPTDWLRAGFVYEGMQANSRQFDQVQSFSAAQPGYTPGVDINPLGTPTVPSAALNSGFFTPQDRVSVAFEPRTLKQTFHFYGWNFSADFAGQSLIYVGSHLDSDFRALTNQNAGNTFPSLSLFQNAATISNNTSHEVRLQNVERVANLFDYVIGYFRQTGNAEIILSQANLIRAYFGQSFPVTGIVSSPVPIYSPPGASKEESIFGNVVAHLGEQVELSGGLRYLKFKNDTRGLFINCTQQALAAGTCTAARGTANNYDLDHVIYNASIRYKLNDDVMFYAMSGSSYRPPVRAVGDFSANPTALELSHVNLDAEKSTSYEIGVKSQWFDRKLTFNLTAYHQDYKNYPYRSASGIYFVNINSAGGQERGQFNFVSAVPVSVNGLESEIILSPSKAFRISAITNYAKSKIKASRLACTDVNGDGIPDTGVPSLTQLTNAYGNEHIAECPSNEQSATFLPNLSGSVQAEYIVPVADKFDGYVRGLMNWRGKAANDPFNPYDNIGAYALFNVFAGLRSTDGGWEITAFAKNVFNLTKLVSAEASPFNNSVTYVNVAAGGAPFGAASYQSYYSQVSVTPPREFGLTARFSIGSR